MAQRPGGYSTERYWANEQGLELASAAMEQVRRYYTRLPKTTAWRRYTKALSQYYGLPSMDSPFDVTTLGMSGEQGELSSVRVSTVGSMGRHILSLVTQSKPAWQPVPINTDYDSVAQSSFCSGLLDYYFRALSIEERLRAAMETAIIFGLAYFVMPWEPKIGQVYGLAPDGVTPLMQADGDPLPRSYSPLEVATDTDRSDSENDWWITRRKVNRWDIVARYAPDASVAKDATGKLKQLRDAIVNQSDDQLPETGGGQLTIAREQHLDGNSRDRVPIYELFHKKTPACPNGVWAQFLSADLLLGSGPLPYDEAPVFQVASNYIVGTSTGDSTLHQAAGLGDIIDNLVSAVVTNNINSAVQLICIPKDAEWDKNSIQGQTLLQCDVGPDGRLVKPEAVQLTQSAPETYKLIELIEDLASKSTGINDVVQGEVPPGGPSGSLLALVQQQAIRYQNGFAFTWDRAIEGSGNMLLKQLQRFATSQKQAVIAGKTKTFELVSFTKDKLANIDRVQIDSTNPITKRPEFMVQTAQDWLAKGIITTPEEYEEVANSGRLESRSESDVTEMLNIRKENEMLRQGQPPGAGPPPFTDHHPLHMKEHRSVLDDPMARTNMQVVTATLAHLQEHMNVWRNAPPDVLTVLGIPLPPPPPMPQGAQPAAGAPPPDSPQGGPPGPTQGHPPPHDGGPTGPRVAPPGEPAPARQPNMPVNPATGQRVAA